MRKGQQIKHKKQSTKQTLRSPQHQPQNHQVTDRPPRENTPPNYIITIKAEKPRKCSDKVLAERQKGAPQNKKIKFITEQIQKSAHDLLSARSKSNHRQRSAKLSPPNAQDENAYELCKSKRSHRGGEKSKRDESDEKHRKKEMNVVNIKTRKSQSKDKIHLQLRLEGLGDKKKAGKKGKNGALSSRKSQKEQHARRFLSPQLVKLENSYYFSNYDQQEEAKPVSPIPNQPVSLLQPLPIPQGTLNVPKKQTKFIFESNQDFWNDPHNKRLLTSTRDLLN